MIRHTNAEPILGAEYELLWDGEIVDIIGPNQGGMKTVMERIAKNPGMQVVARIFHNLGESEDYRQEILERRPVAIG